MKNQEYLKETYEWKDLLAIVHKLRQPDGCPWDSTQTYESMKKCVADEAADLAGGDVQRQVIHCLFVSVGFGQMGNCQHMRHFLSYCVLCPCGRFRFV